VRTTIVGTRFRGPAAILALASLQKGAKLTLRREPENRYDPLAVAAWFRRRIWGVPRDRTAF
jgi:hypothetical protein